MVLNETNQAKIKKGRQPTSLLRCNILDKLDCVLNLKTGKLRQECLRQHWFASLNEARKILEARRHNYNHVGPHSPLKYQTPEEVVRQYEMIKNQSPDWHGACGRLEREVITDFPPDTEHASCEFSAD